MRHGLRNTAVHFNDSYFLRLSNYWSQTLSSFRIKSSLQSKRHKCHSPFNPNASNVLHPIHALPSPPHPVIAAISPHRGLWKKYQPRYVYKQNKNSPFNRLRLLVPQPLEPPGPPNLKNNATKKRQTKLPTHLGSASCHGIHELHPGPVQAEKRRECDGGRERVE